LPPRAPHGPAATCYALIHDLQEDKLMTTSPNSIVYAALDRWRRQMVEHGHRLLSAAIALSGDLRERLGRIDGLHVVQDELLAVEASHDLDPL
jgi:arginine/lysine/ornithine decarboxylase